MKLLLTLSVFALAGSSLADGEVKQDRCPLSVTTASGTAVNGNSFCSGELIFEDNFDLLDQGKWQHEVTLGGGGNNEFQWYVNDRRNSFTQNGVLHIKPTLTDDAFGDGFVTYGVADLGDECTNDQWNGCIRYGSPINVINPVRSARLRTFNSFSFKYGRLEIRAKLPAGDWLWPAIWMMPTKSVYGEWPRSGEIDIMESRGNRNYILHGTPFGTEQIGSTQHFGPDWTANAWGSAHFVKNSAPGQGYHHDFHRYQMEWSPDRIVYKVDDIELGTVWTGDGYWARGAFAQNTPWFSNPWQHAGRDAPFDQEFNIIMNLAVGGTNFFPDDAWNPDPKPWSNGGGPAMCDFYYGREPWLRSWNYYDPANTDSHLKVDYVRVWAL